MFYDPKALFRNCTEVREENGGYLPMRLSQPLIDLYHRTGSEYFAARSLDTAGITMEFITDQKELSFRYECPAFVGRQFGRIWLAFDVYEDGAMLCTIRPQDGQAQGEIRFVKEKDGKSRITVYLPSTVNTRVYDLNFGDAVIPAPCSGPKYLAVGDSITQGMSAISPSLSYVNLVKRHLDADLRNMGINGFYFDPATLDCDHAFTPDLITVAYGTNDARHIEDMESIERAIPAYMEKLRAVFPQAAVNVITPIWRAELRPELDPPFEKKFRRVVELIERQAERQGFHLIDGWQAIPHSIDYLEDQRVHPNELGFACYALHVIRHLQLPR